MTKILVLIGTILVLVALLAVFSYAGILKFPDSSRKAFEQPAQTTQKESPLSGNIATPAAAQFRSIKGNVTSVSSTTIVVNTGTITETLSLSQTKDFQKLVSGTLSGGDGKTTSVTLADLKVGQEVLVIIKLSSSDVLSVLIVK